MSTTRATRSKKSRTYRQMVFHGRRCQLSLLYEIFRTRALGVHVSGIYDVGPGRGPQILDAAREHVLSSAGAAWEQKCAEIIRAQSARLTPDLVDGQRQELATIYRSGLHPGKPCRSVRSFLQGGRHRTSPLRAVAVLGSWCAADTLHHPACQAAGPPVGSTKVACLRAEFVPMMRGLPS